MKGLMLRPREQARIDVLSKVLRREASAADAAEVLSLSQLQVWRLLAALRTSGIAGLVHGNRDRQPVNALPAEMRDRIVALAGERYADANYTHLTELLAEREGIHVSRSTVRNVLIAGELRHARKKRPRYRLRRERLPQEGMLLRIDRSQHRWLGNAHPPFCLFLAVDDATGTIPHALFRRQEDLVGYLQLLDRILRTRGIPSAVYSYRSTIFWPLGGPKKRPIDPRSLGQSVACTKVEVQERLDGAIVVARNGRAIETTRHPGRSSAGLAARLESMIAMRQAQDVSAAAKCALRGSDVSCGLRRQQK